MRILAINPGSTSTKFAIFDDENVLFAKTIRHSVDKLAEYEKIIDQYDFRKGLIIDALEEAEIPINSIDAAVGRGGLLKPIPGGVYKVNDAMLKDIRAELIGEHASNLGAILANEMAKEAGDGVNAFIVDPVVVDEMHDLARYSGCPELPRISIFHALNQKAVARRFARENNKNYEDLNLVIVHLGGGITVGVHNKGKVIDVNNGLDGEGPFTPERTGSLPVGALVKLCFSRKYQYHEMKKLIKGNGGLVAYLNTNDAKEIEERAENGDEKSKQVYEAMAYQISKEIGACSTVLKGKLDVIIITGGLANSEMVTNWIKERTSFIAPVHVYAGEDEMQALAESVYFAHKGEQPIKEYE